MDKSDYVDKINYLLQDFTTYSALNKDPSEKGNRYFHQSIKKLLNGKEDLIKKLSTQNPSTPYMYGIIKTHKPDQPPRPIISSIGSVTYKLSKWLVTLSPLVGTISDSFVKNSEDLVCKLKSINVSYPYHLVSFDVVSLFNKVPIKDVLSFLPNILEENIQGIPRKNIIELIRLCVEDSSFVFEGKFYTQKFGMAMGNPLSPVLANIYMEYFEKHLLNSIKDQHIVWLRYVDDILCFWPRMYSIDNFLVKLNSLAHSIKFTHEVEKDNVLPFLDVSVIRHDGTLKTKVYRKPTNILSYVHFYSNHHINVKRSVFISMYLRAYRISDPEFLKEELDFIQSIGQRLKYPLNILHQCHNSAKKRFHTTQNIDSTPPSHLRNLVLPFHENFLGVAKTLRKLGVRVIFKYHDTIKNTLIRNCPKSDKGVVYKIPCKDCHMFYIGQTGKELQTRISQHKYSVRTGQQSSGLFLHQSEYNHRIDWTGAKVLATSKYFD